MLDMVMDTGMLMRMGMSGRYGEEALDERHRMDGLALQGTVLDRRSDRNPSESATMTLHRLMIRDSTQRLKVKYHLCVQSFVLIVGVGIYTSRVHRLLMLMLMLPQSRQCTSPRQHGPQTPKYNNILPPVQSSPIKPNQAQSCLLYTSPSPRD